MKKEQQDSIIFIPTLLRLEGFVHGFTTRIGGCSKGPYESLNLGYRTGDRRASVKANWTKLSQSLGTNHLNFLTMEQIHGSRVELVRTIGKARRIASKGRKADAIITTLAGILPVVQTADCLPIIIASEDPRMAGIIHAGWRGTVKGIAAKTINKAVKEIGTDIQKIMVAMGPCIGPCCFEINDEIASRFSQSSIVRRRRRVYADLWKENMQQLIEAGVCKKNVNVCGECTSCSKSSYFSHRRDKGRTGRMASFVGWISG